MKYVLAFVALVLAGPALAQFKCTQTDGSVSFQQQPCAAQAKTERLDLPAPAADDGRGDYRAAMAKGLAVPGMTRAELNRIWRSPDKCNTSHTGSGTYDQCIWRWADKTVYIYLRDGVIESIQDNPRENRSRVFTGN